MTVKAKVAGALFACLALGIGVFVASVACSDNAGSGGSDDSPSSAAGAGKGGGDAAGGALAHFVGKWKIDSSNTTSQCNDQPESPSPVQGEVELVATAAGSLELVDSSGCAYVHVVSGTTATAEAGQKCEVAGDQPTTTEVVRSIFSTSDGRTAQLELEHRVKVTFTAQNTTLNCTLQGTAQLSRAE